MLAEPVAALQALVPGHQMGHLGVGDIERVIAEASVADRDVGDAQLSAAPAAKGVAAKWASKMRQAAA